MYRPVMKSAEVLLQVTSDRQDDASAAAQQLSGAVACGSQEMQGEDNSED